MSYGVVETPPDLPPLERAERWRAWWYLMASDHGFVRMIYLNRHRVSDDLWRSAQPAPPDLKRFAAEGFRTVLNLRGVEENNDRYRLEQEACARYGLKLVSIPIRSRNPLRRETLLDAVDIWGRLETPVLMHCKSGADRTGLMAVLYLHLVEGRPMRAAMDQLSLRFGHLRRGRTGIVDHVFEQFAARHEETGIAFRAWVEKEYDPQALQRGFRSRWFSSLLVDRILRRE